MAAIRKAPMAPGVAQLLTFPAPGGRKLVAALGALLVPMSAHSDMVHPVVEIMAAVAVGATMVAPTRTPRDVVEAPATPLER
jgi:hypothetical protein